MYNINKIKKIGIITGITLGTAAIIGTSGLLIKHYFRKSDCNLNYSHLHVYKYNYDDITTVFDSEIINLHGYKWTEKVITYGENDLDRVHFMEEKGLVSIYRNIDYLTEYLEKNSDYEEFQYWYRHRVFDHYDDNNNPVYKYVTRYDYTTDINHSRLTGKARTVHKKYYAYKISYDSLKKMNMIKSDEVDDITNTDLIEYYPYFRPNDFNKIEYYYYNIDIKTKLRK